MDWWSNCMLYRNTAHLSHSWWIFLDEISTSFKNHSAPRKIKKISIFLQKCQWNLCPPQKIINKQNYIASNYQSHCTVVYNTQTYVCPSHAVIVCLKIFSSTNIITIMRLVWIYTVIYWLNQIELTMPNGLYRNYKITTVYIFLYQAFTLPFLFHNLSKRIEHK